MPLLDTFLVEIESMYFNDFNRFFREVKKYANLGISRSVDAVGFIMRDGTGYRLVPSPTLAEIEEYSIELIIPSQLKKKVREWSYVEVVGKPVKIVRPVRGFEFKAKYVLYVEEIQVGKLRFPKVSSKHFINFVDTVFLGLKGVDETTKRDLALALVSSPQILDFAGGVSHVVSSINAKVGRDLATAFRRMVPPRLRKLENKYPYPWRMLLDGNYVSLFEPRRRKPRGFIQEYSASFAAGPLKKALKIAKGSKIELAFIFDDGVEVLTTTFKDIYPEVINFMAKMHFLHPALPPNLEEIASQKSDDLAVWISELKQKGMSEAIVRIIDPSWYATPLSLLRLATAKARSLGKYEVSQDDINSTFEKLVDNIRELQKISDEWEATLDALATGRRPTLMEAKVLDAIRKLEEKLGEPPTKNQIMEKTGIKKVDLDNIIESLRRKGLIYEREPGHFRIVP